MKHSIFKPRRPSGSGWVQGRAPDARVALGFESETWYHWPSALYVISAVEAAAAEGGMDEGSEFHVSISLQPMNRVPERCTTADAPWVCAQFDLLEAEEDNHVPNRFVRYFGRPVTDRLIGLECACKEDEPAVVEDKGDFIWRGITR
jgi:hypothetical protein